MSLMREEALSAPERVASQLAANEVATRALADRLKQRPPRALISVARGSSDHAVAFISYLVMQRLAIPAASLPLSLTTLEETAWRVDEMLALAISQSGRSPDLIDMQRALGAGGAMTVAMVNVPDSPLAQASETTLALHAGEERSVAATKSFLAALAAGAQLVGAWSGDDALLEAVTQLPARLREAAASDWSPAIAPLRDASHMMVVGRGSTLAIAQEAALKFKETCGIQAEAFSGAEIQHGPMALVDEGYPVLILAPPGNGQAGLLELAGSFRSRGACVLLAADHSVAERDLTLTCADHSLLHPLCAIQSFYPMIEQLARARGLDPDHPRHLRKVTETR
ncbi:glutamine--fructose-6-phosphate transaminase [Kushneria sinocarnis]|uniref:Glutamine--fructose-6-phosphate transaminase n=1 Tax=Kushneria sinocarnis TaxID=595502 RepID=A0A420WUE9_9GAMM|nr:SIS domain-containing protein [Kushneria sinocarnis]RKQ97071.1 glutamine--fructose-6-phosphate transaminase [Kushneria sinocarnis]